jgi:hypothetical protein
MTNSKSTSIWSVINNKHKYFSKPQMVPRTSFFGFKHIRLNTPMNTRQIPRNNLTWNQASIRYPKMNPFGDADKDGKLNMFDCRPFNRRKHGDFGMVRVGPPDEYETGEILDPYYEEHEQKMANPTVAPAPVQSAPVPIQSTVSTFAAIKRQLLKVQKWARPGVYNEDDYADVDKIDEYVGSGSGSAAPVRGFQPAGGGTKYG